MVYGRKVWLTLAFQGLPGEERSSDTNGMSAWTRRLKTLTTNQLDLFAVGVCGFDWFKCSGSGERW
jgi:hypothetical protein